jgi:hypothetical protein
MAKQIKQLKAGSVIQMDDDQVYEYLVNRGQEYVAEIWMEMLDRAADADWVDIADSLLEEYKVGLRVLGVKPADGPFTWTFEVL